MNRETELWRMHRFIGDATVKQLIAMGFTKQTASTKYHGCYEGGLFDHSWRVMERLLDLTRKNKLTWKRNRSPYVVALLHDICKVDQYRKTTGLMGCTIYEWVDTEVKGHGEKSVIYAKRIMELTDEEEFCIRYHMGAFSDEAAERQAYSEAAKRFPNVLYTHLADMLASQVDDV